jgi:hypothetical protein
MEPALDVCQMTGPANPTPPVPPSKGKNPRHNIPFSFTALRTPSVDSALFAETSRVWAALAVHGEKAWGQACRTFTFRLHRVLHGSLTYQSICGLFT